MDLHLKRLCWLLVAMPLAGFAQESGQDSAEMAAEIDAMGPAVGSADLESMDAISEDASSEEESPEPAVSTSNLSADVRRSDTNGAVMDELDLGRTEITGNQELPKVLYIVPWQRSTPGPLLGRPVNTLLNEVMAPIDRTEFVREVDYYDDLYREDEE